MRDRWQLFEYLKRNDGCIDGADVTDMDPQELIEGILEYQFFKDNEDPCNVKMLQKKCPIFSKTIEIKKS